MGTIGVVSVALLRESMIDRMDDQLRDLVHRIDGSPEQPSPDDDEGLPTDFAVLVLHGNGTVEVSLPVTAAGPVLPVINSTVTRLVWIEAGVGIALLLALGVIGFLLVRLGLRPLTRIEKTAEDIAGGHLDLRLASDPRTEACQRQCDR